MPELMQWDFPFPAPENQRGRLPQRRSSALQPLETVGIVLQNAVGLLAWFLNGCLLLLSGLAAAGAWGLVVGGGLALATSWLLGWNNNLTLWIVGAALAQIIWASICSLSETTLGETLLTFGRGMLWYSGITGVLAALLRCNWLGLAFLGLPALLLAGLYVSIRNRPEPPVTRQRLPFDSGVDDPDFERLQEKGFF